MKVQWKDHLYFIKVFKINCLPTLGFHQSRGKIISIMMTYQLVLKYLFSVSLCVIIMEKYFDWRQEAFLGQIVNIIDEQSFQAFIADNILSTSSDIVKPIATINKSIILNYPNPVYLFQQPILRLGLSEQSKDKKCKIRIITKDMKDLIFKKLGCSGIEIERRITKTNNHFQIQLYPQTMEFLYINSDILQNYEQIHTTKMQIFQIMLQIGKILVTFSETETVSDLKVKIKRIIQQIIPKIADMRIYCFENCLFQLISFNRYLQYYLLKEDVKYSADISQRKFYQTINNRTNDNFLVQFFPGKILADQSSKQLRQNGIKTIVVEGIISNKWVFPQQPLFSISKNCQFCLMRSHLYRQFSCLQCKNVLMFCSRVCQYQSLLKHPCQSSKDKIISLYGQQIMKETIQNKLRINISQKKIQAKKVKNKINKRGTNLRVNKDKRKRDNEEVNQKFKVMSMLKHGRGIVNLGNTCYMNSAIQIFASTALPQILLKQKILKINKLTGAYIQLINILQQQKQKEFAPFDEMQKFKTVIDCKMPHFSGFDQHDAHQFITVFLDQLHNQLKTKPAFQNVRAIIQSVNEQVYQKSVKEEELGGLQWMKFIKSGQSPLINLFYGQMKNQIKCLYCLNISRQFNPFNILQLSIPSCSQQFNVTIYYEFYQFREKTTLMTVSCGNIKLRDFLNKIAQKIKPSAGENKKHLRSFLLGYEQTFQQYQESVKIGDLVALIGSVNKNQRQLFVFQPPLEYNVYITAKFLNPQSKSFTFKRPLFFNKSKNDITNSMLYQAVTEYLIHLAHLYDQTNQLFKIRMKAKVQSYFKLRLQWQTKIDQNIKRSFYNQGKLIQVNNKVSPELSHHHCELWIELQKFTSSKDRTDTDLYKLITTKLNKCVRFQNSEKDKLNLDDQYLSLQECIQQQFSKKQHLDLGNQVFCPSCNQKRQIQKSTYLYKISRYMIIHLKRFKSGMDGLAYEKNINKIVAPLILNFQNVLKNPTLPEKYYEGFASYQRKKYHLDNWQLDTSESYKYKLKSVILHQGNIQQGHYLTLAESDDGSWWKYNDEEVSQIDIRQQLNLSIIMEKIYILIYERMKP